MRVATLTAYQSITVSQQLFDQQPQAGQALVKVKAVGICGTDLHIFMGNRPDAVPPRVMGHELSGEVIVVGDGVEHITVGDRVVLDQGIVNPSLLISKQFPVEEIQQAFEYTLAHPEGIKTVITFD